MLTLTMRSYQGGGLLVGSHASRLDDGNQTVIGNIHTQGGKRAQLVGNQAMGDDPDEEGALTHSR
jgi:hypothetical protein